MTLDLFNERSTIDDGLRSEGDFYETPAWMTRSLLNFHPDIRDTRVLECCAGRGAIARVLREEAGCDVVENDIDRRHRRPFSYDATTAEGWRALASLGPFDYVVTNLPFNIAIEIIRPGLLVPRRAFISVLLKSFDEPTEDRGGWLSLHPWTRKINQPRHSFRGTGSPSMASDWFIWERERDTSLPPCVVDHLAKTRTRPAASIGVAKDGAR